jgi:hypothetical protein
MSKAAAVHPPELNAYELASLVLDPPPGASRASLGRAARAGFSDEVLASATAALLGMTDSYREATALALAMPDWLCEAMADLLYVSDAMGRTTSVAARRRIAREARS